MASLYKESGGYRIQFIDRHGKRSGIRLGDIPDRDANRTLVKVEALLTAAKFGHELDPETAGWVHRLEGELRDKLEAVELIEKRAASTLGALLTKFMARPDIKPSTYVFYGHTKRYLVKHFGEGRDIRTITVGDAKDFKGSMVKAGLAKNTVARRCVAAASIFKTAIDHKLISSNPFAGLGEQVTGNPDRQYFVSVADAEKILSYCPDAAWRAAFALARWGGLRVPSELTTLKWEDVRWDENKIVIHATKTEHHDNRGVRIIPMFPELLKPLLELHEAPGSGGAGLFPSTWTTTKNLRKGLTAIIRRAGLTPWQKPWQNLRSTRETELFEKFPAHIAAYWIGNSVKVAVAAYTQMRDTYYVDAVKKPAVQNPVQQADAKGCNEDNSDNSKCTDMRPNETDRKLVGVTGLEPVTSSV